MKRFLLYLLFFTLGSNSLALANHYLKSDSILPKSISPALISASKQWSRESLKVINLQKGISDEDIKSAKYEHHFKPEMLLSAVNFKVNKDSHPKLFKLLKQSNQDARKINGHIKYYYNQERPYQSNAKIKLYIKPSKSPSYPSGHAAKSYVAAYILSEILPKYKKEFLKAAAKISQNRVIVGLHFVRDIEKGEEVAKIIFKKLKKNKDFIRDLNLAKSEQSSFASNY